MHKKVKLLAVILITFVGIAAYGKMTLSSKDQLLAEASCKNTMLTLGKRLQLYAYDHNGQLPMESGDTWVITAAKYITPPDILFCPFDKSGKQDLAQARKACAQIGQDNTQQIITYMIRKKQRLTSYVMPKAVAGAKLDKLPSNAVLLQEEDIVHNNRSHRLSMDGKIKLKPNR